MKDLKNKIALVTGGSRGIVAAVAKRFALEGANVAITYQFSADKALAVVKEMEDHGVKAIAIQADATQNLPLMAAQTFNPRQWND